MPGHIPPEFRSRAEVMLGFAEQAAERGEHFFYVRIPESIGPHERGTRYEEPLQEALTTAGLGEVTGGGSQLGEGRSIAYCGVDVVVTDRGRGLALLRQVMQRLGASPHTIIEEFLPSYHEHNLRGRTA